MVGREDQTMLPIVVDPSNLNFGLVGRGDNLKRRLAYLRNSGVKRLRLFSDDPPEKMKEKMGDRIIDHLPEAEELRGLNVLFLCGLKLPETEALTEVARKMRILVNAEDMRASCDFNIPGIVRRGDLLLSVSTGGTSPGLVKRIREQLSEEFGEEWKTRLEEIGKAREIWRQNGASLKELGQMTNALIEEKDWLP